MPEKISDRTIFSLSEVALSIQKTIAERYTSSFWIKAEMNKLNHYPQSGHCYPELVEKADGKIVAEIRSTIWKDDFQRINNHFMEVLQEPLKNGISILLNARISYSPVHGLSLWILDIDPSYTLGELEKEKAADTKIKYRALQKELISLMHQNSDIFAVREMGNLFYKETGDQFFYESVKSTYMLSEWEKLTATQKAGR